MLQNGIPPKVVATIIKYRNNGGYFRTKDDVKKIYTLEDSIYLKIEPYIKIEDQSKREIGKATIQVKEFSEEKIEIDINRAPSEEWEQLRGIGPSFSKRIIKFRDKLGGFYDVNQVRETYGLPDSTFQNIKPQLRASNVFRKINLNQAEVEDLKSHPYISWNQAKIIVSYRNMHGDFQKIDELLKIGPLTREWLEKVKPYLSI